MTLEMMHSEDVKTLLRKRYGTIRAFTEEHALPKTGVSDLFRGRTSARVREAVEKAVTESIKLDDSAVRPRTQRRIGGAA